MSWSGDSKFELRFRHGESIVKFEPRRGLVTCDMSNKPPSLCVRHAPGGTLALALVLGDHCGLGRIGERNHLKISVLVHRHRPVAGGVHNPTFDLTGDGLVDLADRDAWLVGAGSQLNTSGRL